MFTTQKKETATYRKRLAIARRQKSPTSAAFKI
jgi:hypothetical protein